MINNQFGLPTNTIPPKTSDETTLQKILGLEEDLVSIASTNQQLNETLIGVGETITTVLDQVLSLEQDILATEQEILVGIGTNQTILNANTVTLGVIDNNTKLIPGII